MISHKAVTILRFVNMAPSYPNSPAIKIYNTRARSAALCGAELWGHWATQKLGMAENDFTRSLLILGRNTPLVPLKLDLDLNPISSEASFSSGTVFRVPLN